MTRRAFVGAVTSCGAHLLFLRPGLGRPAREFRAGALQGAVVTEPWGRLEPIGKGLWALVSTPLDGDRTTLCNGGIVTGRSGTLVVESFATPNGAAWIAEQARSLTGRWPTHVVLTHFHGDHTNGVEGYEATGALLQTTATTRDLVLREDAARNAAADSVRARMLADIVVLDPDRPTTVDLGGRIVRLVPWDGHTPSDLTIEVDDPSVVYCGDLVWNRMFPNYRDALPSRLSRAVRGLAREPETVYVPGHGPLAGRSDLDRYVALLDDIEAAARRAFGEGVPAAEAAKRYTVPATLGDWVLFSPRYYEVALSAWERELAGR